MAQRCLPVGQRPNGIRRVSHDGRSRVRPPGSGPARARKAPRNMLGSVNQYFDGIDHSTKLRRGSSQSSAPGPKPPWQPQPGAIAKGYVLPSEMIESSGLGMTPVR
jgi:hypothetical protein